MWRGKVLTAAPRRAVTADGFGCWWSRAAGLDESPDEVQAGLGYFLPSAVDGERVPAVGDLGDFGDAGVFALLLVGCAGDRPGNLVVFLAADDQHGPAVGVPLVGLGLGAGVEVGEGSLEDRYAGARHVILLIQLPCFVLADGVAEAVAELLEGQRHCPVPVGGVREDRGRGLDRGGRQRQDTARGCRVDSHGGGG